MNTRFFTDAYDTFQVVVILQRQGYRNLVQLVFRKNHLQIAKTSQDLYPSVKRSGRNMIVQNSHCGISPLRIVCQSVNILLRRSGISHQKNVLQIIALAPDGSQPFSEDNPKTGSNKDIEHIKQRHN